MTRDSIAQLLRSRIRGHNLSIVAASGATLILVIAAWAALYGIASWTTMFIQTILHAGDATMPAWFDRVFLIGASLLLIAGIIDTWASPSERVEDERSLSNRITDIALFLPRLTVSVVMNFTAWARLPDPWLDQAAMLLELLRERQKLPVTTLPQFIPNDQTLDRILHVLKLLQIVDTHCVYNEWWLRTSSLAPKELRSLIPEDTHDDMAGMRSATVFEHKDSLPSPKRQLPADDRHHL